LYRRRRLGQQRPGAQANATDEQQNISQHNRKQKRRMESKFTENCLTNP
jgi:hypothetical protein